MKGMKVQLSQKYIISNIKAPQCDIFWHTHREDKEILSYYQDMYTDFWIFEIVWWKCHLWTCLHFCSLIMPLSINGTVQIYCQEVALCTLQINVEKQFSKKCGFPTTVYFWSKKIYPLSTFKVKIIAVFGSVESKDGLLNTTTQGLLQLTCPE